MWGAGHLKSSDFAVAKWHHHVIISKSFKEGMVALPHSWRLQMIDTPWEVKGSALYYPWVHQLWDSLPCSCFLSWPLHFARTEHFGGNSSAVTASPFDLIEFLSFMPALNLSNFLAAWLLTPAFSWWRWGWMSDMHFTLLKWHLLYLLFGAVFILKRLYLGNLGTWFRNGSQVTSNGHTWH